jgi:hypothetical protein
MLLSLEVPPRVAEVLVRETRAPGVREAPDLDAANPDTHFIAARIVAGALCAHTPPRQVGVPRRIGRCLVDDIPTPAYSGGRQQDLLQGHIGGKAVLRSHAGFALRGSRGRGELFALLLKRPAPKPLGTRALVRVVDEADAAVWPPSGSSQR